MSSYAPSTVDLMRSLAESIDRAYPAPAGSRDVGPGATPDGYTERYFGSVLSVLLNAFVVAGPKMVADVTENNRDFFGDDTRDAAFAERGLLIVAASFLPCLSDLTNAVIGTLAAQRDVEPPTTEQQQIQRWFGPVLAAALPVVIPAVSDLISSLTQGRDISAAPVTDPNVAPRWFGPILGGVVLAVSSALPQVLALFNEPQQ